MIGLQEPSDINGRLDPERLGSLGLCFAAFYTGVATLEVPGPAPAPSKVLTFDTSEVDAANADNLTPSQTVTESHAPVSLPNGTDLVPALDSLGLGRLKISNYLDHDAVVKLKTSDGRTTVRFFYVRAKSDVIVSKILPGEYVLQFATGRDWDTINLAFRQDQSFTAFDKMLAFSERHVGAGTVYSTQEVTLHAAEMPFSLPVFSTFQSRREARWRRTDGTATLPGWPPRIAVRRTRRDHRARRR